MTQEEIRQAFIDKIKKGEIQETGYDCPSGNEYVELRNVQFVVNRYFIFPEVRSLDRVHYQWYMDNYEPILLRNNQFDKCIEKLGKNDKTRQAVLIMGDVQEFDSDYFICTMYMHIFLDKQEDGSYNMMYIVHMRSNDAIEFGNDIIWHKNIAARICYTLKQKYGYDVNLPTIVWNADSFHVYKEYFHKIVHD